MCFSCHIRHLTKCPNWCRTWNICFLLIFSWKMLQPNFAFWDIFMLLRCLNSKEIKLQSSINVICIIFDLIFFQLKIKRKQIFQVRHQFGHFVKCRIWHEKHKSQKYSVLCGEFEKEKANFIWPSRVSNFPSHDLNFHQRSNLAEEIIKTLHKN